jgi:hypothetical protein
VYIRGSGKVVRKLCAPCASSTQTPPTITNVKVAGRSSRCDAEVVQGIGGAIRAIAEGDTQALGCACAAELSASKVGPCVQHQHKLVFSIKHQPFQSILKAPANVQHVHMTHRTCRHYSSAHHCWHLQEAWFVHR